MEKIEKSGLKDNVVQFIQKFRIFLLIIVALIVIGIVSAIAVEEITKSSIASLSAMIEQLDASNSAVGGAKTEDEKKNLQSDFDNAFKKATESFKGTFAEQRAFFLQGNQLFSEKKFADAEQAFYKSYTVLPKSYLAPVALMNSAFAAEEARGSDKAVELLKKLCTEFDKKTALVSRAWFNVGRISEERQKWADAKDAYQKIIDTAATSNWTKLAKDRIIYLKAESKL
jgi:tetratricopeptide (TPR) repeat protein